MKVTIEVNELNGQVSYKSEPGIPSAQFCSLLFGVIMAETYKNIDKKADRLVQPVLKSI